MQDEIQSVGGHQVSDSTPTEARSALDLASANLPTLPQRDGAITIARLIELYMAHYSGRDASCGSKLSWWSARLGHLTLTELDDDHVGAGLDALAERPGRYYAGKDADGKPIHKARRSKLAPASVNRYHSALASVITWAIKRRIAPKGYVHPCRSVESRPENNARTRFLSDDERTRLLDACRAAAWPKLYLLVLMALTTGARRGELLGLHWRDVDLERAVASVGRTKNGDPRMLPLTPGVCEEMKRMTRSPSSLVFARAGDPTRVFTFEPHFRKALAAAKVRDFTFHCLRHSCASMLAQRGRTLLEIADLLGHRQLQMTKRYAHLCTGHKAAMAREVFGDIR